MSYITYKVHALNTKFFYIFKYFVILFLSMIKK